jgi:hypothetical protein
MRFIAVLFAAFSVCACQMTYSASRKVVVKGPQPTEERLRIAEEVGTDLYQHRLPEAVKERFALSDEQIKGVYVRWGTTKYTNIIGNKLPNAPVVTLDVGIQHHGEIKNADEIAAFCAQLTREALAKRGLSGARFRRTLGANANVRIL